ncbi:MAG: glycosyltransferase [Candidatus Margulisbacteria bacterium]|nr:glycosyltransferase [Candidatus Margulisiibacteriota bacterium]
MAPKVSVCMITYNHEAFIAQSIESVLAQKTNFDVELVIGEDCSTDKTREIILGYKAQYPERIRLLLPDKNIGMAKNFIQCLQTCTGQYVALLEGDDFWNEPDKLQRQADILDAHSAAAICFNCTRVIYTAAPEKSTLYPEPDFAEWSSLPDLLNKNFMHTCSVMFRNRLFKTFPDWFEKILTLDHALHILNARFGDIYYLPEVLSTYRVHAGGIFSPQKTEHFERNCLSALLLNVELQKLFKYQYTEVLQPKIDHYYFGLVNHYRLQKKYMKAAGLFFVYRPFIKASLKHSLKMLVVLILYKLKLLKE